MIELHVGYYYGIAQHLAALEEMAGRLQNPKHPLSEEMRRQARGDGSLAALLAHCERAGLSVSVRAIRELQHDLESPMAADELSRAIAFVHKAIGHELDSIVVFQVDKGRMQFLEATVFGPGVVEHFPSVEFDGREAKKCFAFARNTACVFHLMRIMELGLYSIATHVNVPLKNRRDWDTVLVQIEARLHNGTAEKKEFLIDAAAQLRAVKRAWRNPVMHVASSYDDEQTRDIYTAVKSFMQHLATELREV